MAKIKWTLVWGIAAILAFSGLLAVRLGYFAEKEPVQPVHQKPSLSRPTETWMNIYQNKQKIGVIHRKFNQLEQGKYHTEEYVTLQINTLGVTQPLHLTTETEPNPDLTFSSFKFELNSSLFRFSANGYAAKDKLIVFAGLPHARTKTIFPIKDIPLITGNVYDAAFLGGLAKDQSREFSIFDPSTMGMRRIIVTRNADEVIPIMGKRILTQKFCADFMGAKNCAWINKEGEVLKETGLLGLSMEKVSPDQARVGIIGNGADLTQVASIPSNVSIAEPSKMTRIEIKITGLSNHYFLTGKRQKFVNSILSITKEKPSEIRLEKSNDPSIFKEYLKPSPLVQSDDPQMSAQVKKIVLPDDPPLVKVTKIVRWVYKTVEKKPVLSVPNAVEVLKNKVGDCNEHAVLTAALLRAAGIPTEIEAGLVYLNGRFYYHAWNSAYIGAWLSVDSVFNQIPADVTHIRLVRGEGSEQLDLLGVLGKIKLEVLSTSYD